MLEFVYADLNVVLIKGQAVKCWWPHKHYKKRTKLDKNNIE